MLPARRRLATCCYWFPFDSYSDNLVLCATEKAHNRNKNGKRKQCDKSWFNSLRVNYTNLQGQELAESSRPNPESHHRIIYWPPLHKSSYFIIWSHQLLKWWCDFWSGQPVMSVKWMLRDANLQQRQWYSSCSSLLFCSSLWLTAMQQISASSAAVIDCLIRWLINGHYITDGQPCSSSYEHFSPFHADLDQAILWKRGQRDKITGTPATTFKHKFEVATAAPSQMLWN